MTREKIMADIRRALGPPEARLGDAPALEPARAEARATPRAEREGGLLEGFTMALHEVGGEVVDARAGAGAGLAGLLREAGLKEAFAGPGVDLSGLELERVDQAAAASRPQRVLGVARAAWGVARSGSVVVEGDGALLPLVLVESALVLLPADRIVATLADLPEPRGRRMIVTGPARTADIEKKVVLGAHGAKRFVVAVTGTGGPATS